MSGRRFRAPRELDEADAARKQAGLEVDRCDELLAMSRAQRRRRGVLLSRETIERIRAAALERAGLAVEPGEVVSDGLD